MQTGLDFFEVGGIDEWMDGGGYADGDVCGGLRDLERVLGGLSVTLECKYVSVVLIICWLVSRGESFL